jgi:hypothetical protein
MGFVILVAMGVYLLLSLGVVAGAISYAKKNGKSIKKWGWGAALLMYMIPFWDWVPTVALHQFYCAKDSGFWVYKSLDQWKAENPKVMEGLVTYNKNPGEFNVNWPSEHKRRSDGRQKEITEHINERFDEIVSWEDVSSILLIIRRENVFLDVKNNEVIARYVDFGTGNSVKNTIGPPGPMKFWLHSGSCIGGREKLASFGKFYIQFQGAEK